MVPTTADLWREAVAESENILRKDCGETCVQVGKGRVRHESVHVFLHFLAPGEVLQELAAMPELRNATVHCWLHACLG